MYNKRNRTRILHIMLILRIKYPVCRGHYYIYIVTVFIVNYPVCR